MAVLTRNILEMLMLQSTLIENKVGDLPDYELRVFAEVETFIRSPVNVKALNSAHLSFKCKAIKGRTFNL